MDHFFFGLAALAFFVAVAASFRAESVFQEIAALLVYLIASIFLSAGAILSALRRSASTRPRPESTSSTS